MDLLGRTVTVLAGFTLALVFLPAAFAASASVAGGTQIAYTAAAGEINDVLVFEAGVEALRIADAGAEIIAGAGCIAESVHQVRCVGLSRGFFRIKLVLGDGNDSASLDDFGGGYGNAHVGVHGGSGDDLIGGSYGTDRLYGNEGADVLRASLCDSRTGFRGILDGGPGDDDLKGGGCDSLVGGKGADLISGTSDSRLREDSADYSRSTRPIVVRLDGKPGDGARGENDNAGRGIDLVYGGSADDLLIGNDHLGHGLFGGPGADTLKGGARNDFLSGQRGNDRILAGSGRDTSLGGSGNDVFDVRDGFRDFIGGGPGTDRARIDFGLDRVRRVERRF